MLWSAVQVAVAVLSLTLFCPRASALSKPITGSNPNRRQVVHSTTTAAALTAIWLNPPPQPSYATTAPYLVDEYFQIPQTAPEFSRSYFPTLLPPIANRATYLHTLGRDMFALEQLLAFANVTASIRSTVVRLQSTGNLWVHSPQWPTGELCHLLDSLEGDVEHIVLPCNALEHKAPVGAFCKKYPNAKVWISPGQYGPFGACGQDVDFDETKTSKSMGYRVDGILGDAMEVPPSWLNEFDMALLYVDLPENAGPVSEVAFCHRPSKTLIATDAVVFIPPKAPPIFDTYFDANTIEEDTFWPRTVLQAVFLPLRIDPSGAYPGYIAIKNRLIRAPILRAFADARAPDAVREWVTKISRQSIFDRIVTSHFASPIAATPFDFASCFSYLNNGGGGGTSTFLPPIECQNWELLEGLNKVIADYNLGAPASFDYKKDCQ